MKAQIAPSMMCVDMLEMKNIIDTFERNKISYLHIDVMDGVFVPNYTLGTDYVKNLRKITDIPLDIHLMITNPEDKLAWFEPRPGDYVSVHVESTNHVQRALQRIKSFGAKAMVALNPATPLNVLEYVVDDIDAVLLMTVNPGFAGQELIKQMITKISDLRSYLDEKGFPNIEIEVDGNVSFENATLMRKSGADIFIAGSSSIFTDSMLLDEAIAKLYDAII